MGRGKAGILYLYFLVIPSRVSLVNRTQFFPWGWICSCSFELDNHFYITDTVSLADLFLMLRVFSGVCSGAVQGLTHSVAFNYTSSLSTTWVTNIRYYPPT
ncbi:hypothetical protein F5X98DRAFT_107677 [Xylaria grammica]|nr:hypothetical protein F5X98DRAFT_107677 [Xylaria grammica]